MSESHRSLPPGAIPPLEVLEDIASRQAAAEYARRAQSVPLPPVAPPQPGYLPGMPPAVFGGYPQMPGAVMPFQGMPQPYPAPGMYPQAPSAAPRLIPVYAPERSKPRRHRVRMAGVLLTGLMVAGALYETDYLRSDGTSEEVAASIAGDGGKDVEVKQKDSANTSKKEKKDLGYVPGTLEEGESCIALGRYAVAATGDVIFTIKYSDGTVHPLSLVTTDKTGKQVPATSKVEANKSILLKTCINPDKIVVDDKQKTVVIPRGSIEMRSLFEVPKSAKQFERMSALIVPPAANGVRYPFSEAERTRVNKIIQGGNKKPTDTVNIAVAALRLATLNQVPEKCGVDLNALTGRKLTDAVRVQITNQGLSGYKISFSGTPPKNTAGANNQLASAFVGSKKPGEYMSKNFNVTNTTITCTAS